MDEALALYKEEGYCIMDNLIDPDAVARFKKSFMKLALRVAENQAIAIADESEAYIFHRLVPAIYEKNPKAGGFFYDSINTHVDFLALFNNEKLNKAVARMLGGEDGRDLSAMMYQFFINRPNDKKMTLGWHQDSGYYRDRVTEEQSLVVWWPLFDCNLDDGALWFVPGSHKLGVLSHESNAWEERRDKEWDKNGEKFLSKTQFDISKATQKPMKACEVGFFHLNLVHKSGQTTSDRVRYTSLARYSNIYGKNYLPRYNVW